MLTATIRSVIFRDIPCTDGGLTLNPGQQLLIFISGNLLQNHSIIMFNAAFEDAYAGHML